MTTLNISQHRLDGAPFKASPNTGGAFTGGRPDAIVIHFTGGASAASAIATLTDGKAANKVSAHVVVDRDGTITQLVPFDTVAWHAGNSSYGGRDGYNRYSIGIEIDNPGRLTRTEQGTFKTWFGRTVDGSEVVTLSHRNEHSATPWQVYPEAQLSAVFALCAALCASYPIKEILGHEEIAPGRKTDPGPAFPLERLRDGLIGAGRSSDGPAVPATVAVTPPVAATVPTVATTAKLRGFVNANALNIRIAPRVDAPTAAAPLTRGTLVEVVGREPGWYQVKVGATTGWVKADYLKI